jgi:uncharacterized membrane protein
MWRIFGGAVLVIAGVAAFIEAHSNKPVPASAGTIPGSALERAEYRQLGVVEQAHPASGLSQTAYDLLRIGAWALVIIGALVVVVGLIAYWRKTPERTR